MKTSTLRLIDHSNLSAAAHPRSPTYESKTTQIPTFHCARSAPPYPPPFAETSRATPNASESNSASSGRMRAFSAASVSDSASAAAKRASLRERKSASACLHLTLTRRRLSGDCLPSRGRESAPAGQRTAAARARRTARRRRRDSRSAVCEGREGSGGAGHRALAGEVA